MDKRVFAAINLPSEIRAEIEAVLFEAEPSWRGIITPRILDRENWHITMGFFGNRSEAEIGLIKEAIEETASAFAEPEIKLRKMIFGPIHGKEARMIWLEVESKDLENVKKSFDQNLEKRGLNLENKGFSPHITLARFQPVNFDRLPALENKIDLVFRAKSLDLMESILSSKGSVYGLISEIDFGGVK
ncbi:MAG TPA: RNA 2',3'-cyclic phosphodiesterase [Candidatus Colwellbacteria bacterium]|nr:RNA 2',3'-cyclic phosphodiesterase [Candidatus Colwellbacteria bacterium]